MRKRFIGILMATTMVFSLAGCGASEQTVSEQAEAESVVEVEQEASEVESESVEVEPETEQAEENESVENLEGFEYHLTFDIDGTQKVIGINAPEGYELGYTSDTKCCFVNTSSHTVSLSVFTEDVYGEDPINEYNNYLETGEWEGLFPDIITSELLNERTIEVPGGTARIITSVSSYNSKIQEVFIDFDGCIVYMEMDPYPGIINWDEGIVSGTEDEYIIDDVLATIFEKRETTEYLYPISETSVEYKDGIYEYAIVEYDAEIDGPVPFLGFNLPEGDYVEHELLADHKELGSFNFTASNGNAIDIGLSSMFGGRYVDVALYRHFLRTGEMTPDMSNSFWVGDDFSEVHSGDLVDMQLGETVETPYGTAYIVKGLWQYDNLTEVSETVLLNVNDREVVITYHNRNAEAGTTLDGYESQLKDMLAVMF